MAVQKKKSITLDDLARMVKHGFDDVGERFNDVDKRFDRIELMLSSHQRRIIAC